MIEEVTLFAIMFVSEGIAKRVKGYIGMSIMSIQHPGYSLPDNEQRAATRSSRRKMARSQAEPAARPSAQEGVETIPPWRVVCSADLICCWWLTTVGAARPE